MSQRKLSSFTSAWMNAVRSVAIVLALCLPAIASSQDPTFGEQLLSQKKYEMAARHFWEMAGQGDARAMQRYALSVRGLVQENGVGIAMSGAIVYPYYLLAANAGDAEAQHMVCAIAIPLPEGSRDIPDKDDMSKALSYCMLAARNGHELASKNLAYFSKDFPSEVFRNASVIADAFEPIPLPNFGSAPPPSWFEFAL